MRPSFNQMDWLRRGLSRPSGGLPLFDGTGARISDKTVESCIKRGWAEPWFDVTRRPGWQVCKLTDKGRTVAGRLRLVTE